MSQQDKTELSVDYPQEYSSFMSIDMPYLDQVSSESLAKENEFCPAIQSVSTEDLTERRTKRSPCVPRQMSRTKSMDRYRTERRSTRSSLSTGSTRRQRQSASLRSKRSTSLRPTDLLLVSREYRPSLRLNSTVDVPRSASSLSAVIARKERRRRRIVLIIMISFLILVLASILVVVVTLTHSSVVNVHNVTSKYYTFAAPPHHPHIRQENERMMHESLNIGTANNTQPMAAQRTSTGLR